jgi:hypothetical protein
MRHIRLKISDLANVNGYTRFQMRGLLSELFPNAQSGEGTLAKRVFSPHELLVVTVACEIERKFGVKRAVLALASKALSEALTGPRIVARGARLVVTFTPPAATYLVADSALPQEGLVVALGGLFARVDEYLGVAGPDSDRGQTTLPLTASVGAPQRGRRRSRDG